MLADHIEALKEGMLWRMFGDGDAVELGQMRDRGAPPSVVRKLTEEVSSLLEEERERRQRSPLNYGHPKVKALLEGLDELLMEVATFRREEVERLVEEHVRWEVWIRLAPSEMVPKLIFREDDLLPAEEVVRAVERLPLGGAYLDGLRKLLEGERKIGREELKDLLWKVEREAMARDPVGFLMEGLASLMEFFLGRRVREEDGVDLDVLENLLRGRGMEEWARLIRVQRALGYEKWKFSQVREVLKMFYEVEEERPPEDITPISLKELIGPRPEASLPPLRELIGRRERYFIRKLFGKDREVYEAVLDRLEPIRDAQQAEAELEECYRIYGLEGDSKAAEEFREVVLSRYG